MNEWHLKLKQLKLFHGLSEEFFEDALKHLKSKVEKYKKGSIIILEGSKIKSIGIVLEGIVEISRVDYTGTRLIVNQLEYPSMFGEALVCADIELSPVTLTAITPVTILLIDFKCIVKSKQVEFNLNNLLVSNMLSILAEKNLFLRQKLELMSKRSIRAKLSEYLLNILESVKQNTIKIPYNRIQLADYLGVNRSALSKELCKMRDEGLIDFKKNHFEVLEPAKLSFYAKHTSNPINAKEFTMKNELLEKHTK